MIGAKIKPRHTSINIGCTPRWHCWHSWFTRYCFSDPKQFVTRSSFTAGGRVNTEMSRC